MIKLALPVLKVPWFIKKYQQHKPTMRPLTTGEMVMAQSVFGNKLNYQTVRVVNYPYVPWQTSDMFIAPNGWIFVGDRHYRTDYSTEDVLYQQVFIHELTHVLQHQQGINVLCRGAYLQSLYYLSCKKYNPYLYRFDPHKSFWAYNIEQQGKIAEAIFMGKLPNIITSPKTQLQT